MDVDEDIPADRGGVQDDDTQHRQAINPQTNQPIEEKAGNATDEANKSPSIDEEDDVEKEDINGEDTIHQDNVEEIQSDGNKEDDTENEKEQNGDAASGDEEGDEDQDPTDPDVEERVLSLPFWPPFIMSELKELEITNLKDILNYWKVDFDCEAAATEDGQTYLSQIILMDEQKNVAPNWVRELLHRVYPLPLYTEDKLKDIPVPDLKQMVKIIWDNDDPDAVEAADRKQLEAWLCDNMEFDYGNKLYTLCDDRNTVALSRSQNRKTNPSANNTKKTDEKQHAETQQTVEQEPLSDFLGDPTVPEPTETHPFQGPVPRNRQRNKDKERVSRNTAYEDGSEEEREDERKYLSLPYGPPYSEDQLNKLKQKDLFVILRHFAIPHKNGWRKPKQIDTIFKSNANVKPPGLVKLIDGDLPLPVYTEPELDKLSTGTLYEIVTALRPTEKDDDVNPWTGSGTKEILKNLLLEIKHDYRTHIADSHTNQNT